MLPPVVRLNGSIGNWVAAVNHHPVADINAHMGCATGVVGFLEEDQVSGLCLTLRDNVAFSHQTVGRLPAYIPAIAAVLMTQLTKPEQSKLVLGELPPQT